MTKVLFVCVHNSGRSQMAEAFFNWMAGGRAEAVSAGTDPAAAVDPTVIEVMQEAGINISGNVPKALMPEMLHDADRVITMGCGVEGICPVTFVETEDWGLPDPKERTIEEVRRIRDEIRGKVTELLGKIPDQANRGGKTMEYRPPEWAYEFHGHLCPFMPLGYRMAKLAMAELGVDREKDHGFFVISEQGVGHPQTCLVDGIQVATGATFGKSLLDKTFWGKLAAVFYHPDKGAVRFSLKPDFMDEFGKLEFFAYRKKGVEPSQIPEAVAKESIEWTYAQPDEQVFKIEELPDYQFNRVKGSFNKAKCAKCGEYVFERYVRMVNGEPYCIPCSGY